MVQAAPGNPVEAPGNPVEAPGNPVEDGGGRHCLSDSTEVQLKVETEEVMMGNEVTTTVIIIIILGFLMEIKEVMIEAIIIAIIVALLDHLMKTVEEAMIVDP